MAINTPPHLRSRPYLCTVFVTHPFQLFPPPPAPAQLLPAYSLPFAVDQKLVLLVFQVRPVTGNRLRTLVTSRLGVRCALRRGFNRYVRPTKQPGVLQRLDVGQIAQCLHAEGSEELPSGDIGIGAFVVGLRAGLRRKSWHCAGWRSCRS